MGNSKIEQAREYLAKRHHELAKQMYNEYFHSLGSINDFDDFDKLYPFKDEYIEVVTKSNFFNVSESNPIYADIYNTKIKINEKLSSGENLSDYEDNTRKLMYYKLVYNIHWGHHAKKSVLDILNYDPEYILWCIINLQHFAIDSVIFLLPNVKAQHNYADALEFNLCKLLAIDKLGAYKEADDDRHSYHEDTGYTAREVEDMYRDAYGLSHADNDWDDY